MQSTNKNKIALTNPRPPLDPQPTLNTVYPKLIIHYHSASSPGNPINYKGTRHQLCLYKVQTPNKKQIVLHILKTSTKLLHKNLSNMLGMGQIYEFMVE